MYTSTLLSAVVVLFLLATSTRSVKNWSTVVVALNSWITPETEIQFVTFPEEGLAVPWLNLLPLKFTVWDYWNSARPHVLAKNRILNKSTVIFQIVPSKYVKSFLNYYHSTRDPFPLTHVVLLMKSKDFRSHANDLLNSVNHLDVSAVSLEEAPYRAIRCEKGLNRNRCSKLVLYDKPQDKDVSPRKVLFSGEEVRLGCVKTDYTDWCSGSYNAEFRRVLSQKNVSLTVATYAFYDALFWDLYLGKLDLGLATVGFNENNLAYLSFARLNYRYETFYSSDNETRVVTLLQAVGRSPCVIVALACLTCCAVTAAATRKLTSKTDFLLEVLGEELFLLAPLLGTSSSETRGETGTNVRILVYAVWILGMLPFSVYFRSELTSQITLSRPANYLDTLEELEDALDAGKVLLCAVEVSNAHDNLRETSEGAGILLQKLRVAYNRQKKNPVGTNTISDCLRCAAELNGVCYTNLFPSCVMKDYRLDVGQFKEPFTVNLAGFPMCKNSELVEPFRRFMHTIEQGSLIKNADLSCKREVPSTKSTIELFAFFADFFGLLCVAFAVFLVEILFGSFPSRQNTRVVRSASLRGL
ncbi:hypothetical protein HPB48_018243 [Haemaphysalis longicornis]|uniref:Ionotropic receptor n=1 Tax=Haemaphysalis longicornis TaxID=44386 RepID=A0A9J6FFH0_HAELO|nr:hypothetical protein HPB48_018243 [Haemaphysalis longicornis]